MLIVDCGERTEAAIAHKQQVERENHAKQQQDKGKQRAHRDIMELML